MSLNETTSIPNIRDRRDRRWFWSDNQFIEEYAAIVGVFAVGVYIVLCERAYNNTQKAEVSGGVIADLLGCGRTSITEALYALEVHSIIDIEEQRDHETRQQLPSIYTLLNCEAWQKEPSPERIEFAQTRRDEARRARMEKKERPKRTTRKSLSSDIVEVAPKTKTKGYTATRHRVSSGRHRVGHDTVDPLPSDGKMPSPNGIKYKEQDDNKTDKTTTTNSASRVSSAVADVVVDVQEHLSHSETATESALPIIPATTTSKQPGGAAAELANRLCLAAEAIGLELSLEAASRVVAASPVAAMTKEQVLRLIGPDRAQIGLNSSIGGEARKNMMADVGALRWLVFLWPQFKRETEDDAKRRGKTVNLDGVFVTRWRDEAKAPQAWLEKLCAEEEANTRAEKRRVQNERTDAVLSSLSPAARAALDEDLRARVRQMPGSIDANMAQLRRELLSDEAFVGRLRATPEPEVVPARLAPGLRAEHNEPSTQAWEPSSRELPRLTRYATSIAWDAEGDALDGEAIEERIKAIAPVQHEQNWVRAQVLSYLEARKAA